MPSQNRNLKGLLGKQVIAKLLQNKDFFREVAYGKSDILTAVVY
jgi:hypothetical protein